MEQGRFNPIPPNIPYMITPTFYEENFVVQNQPQRNPENTKRGCLFYSCGGCCGLFLSLIIILGIAVHIYWLGIFGFAALVPGLFILWLLYWRNSRNTAFLDRVVKFIAFGMLGVLPVALIELGLSIAFSLAVGNHQITIGMIFLSAFFNAFFIASLCEETFKYFVASMISVQSGRDVPYSVVVYSMASAVGLASLENLMYIVIVGLDGSLFLTLFTTITRAILAVPLHATTGVLIGCDMAEKRFNIHNKNIFQILMYPFLLHGIYDFCTMFASSYAGASNQNWIFFLPLFSILMVVIGVWYAKKRRLQILSLENDTYIPMSNINNV